MNSDSIRCADCGKTFKSDEAFDDHLGGGDEPAHPWEDGPRHGCQEPDAGDIRRDEVGNVENPDSGTVEIENSVPATTVLTTTNHTSNQATSFTITT